MARRAKRSKHSSRGLPRPMIRNYRPLHYARRQRHYYIVQRGSRRLALRVCGPHALLSAATDVPNCRSSHSGITRCELRVNKHASGSIYFDATFFTNCASAVAPRRSTAHHRHTLPCSDGGLPAQLCILGQRAKKRGYVYGRMQGCHRGSFGCSCG